MSDGYHWRGSRISASLCTAQNFLCVNARPGTLEYFTVADSVPRNFKRPLLKKTHISFYIPTELLPGRTTLCAVNSIKLCRWPISLAMSSGKYMTNGSSRLHVPRGLWLQGAPRSKLWGKHNHMQMTEIAASSMRREGGNIVPVTPLCYAPIYYSGFSHIAT